FYTNLIPVTNLIAIYVKRVTIQEKDMKLVQRIRLGIMGISRISERLLNIL
ncbi:hypothetical protein F5882DRAFT_305074, partial [Hyaloscypha sp. PMI_1271]